MFNKTPPPLVFAIAAAALAASATLAAGETHLVGDVFGWTNLGADTDFYNLWAAIYDFHVNDTLQFRFETGEHSVAEVTRRAYEECDATDPIALYTKGPELNITLTSPGHRYFICTFPGHCRQDERLAVSINSTSSHSSILN